MLKNIYNFCAGPAALPNEVMLKAESEFRNFNNIGASIIEMSHRSPIFTSVIEKAERNVRFLMDIPDDYSVFFIQGGASFQFSMLPMNLLADNESAAYVDTGRWAQKAIDQAKFFSKVEIAASGKSSNYSQIPVVGNWIVNPNSKYLHVTSNNTVYGTQLHEFPEFDGVPIVADLSSDIMSREVNMDKIAVAYAGLQKNLGPSGMSVVIMHPDFVDLQVRRNPDMLRYSTYRDHKSLYNTPNTFAIYMLSLVTDWIREQGGVGVVERINDVKSELVYEEIDASDGYYRGMAFAPDRSRMNVCFNLPTEKLDNKFVEDAAKEKLINLAGHRSVGGIRASIYNAMPLKGISKLIDFMRYFREENPV